MRHAVPLVLLLSLAAACSGHRREAVAVNIAPTLVVEQPGAAVAVRAGEAVTIVYRDDDPDDVATTDLYADQDGDLATQGDQVLIEAGRPEQDGAEQTVVWDTTGVPPAPYRIIGRITDGEASVTAPAPGTVGVDPVPPPATTLQLDYARKAGGEETDGVAGVAGFPDGSYVVAGFFQGSAVFGEGEVCETILEAERRTWFAARYHQHGELDWAMAFPGDVQVYAVAAFGNGDFVVTGTFLAAVTLGAGEPNETRLVPVSGGDALVARYDSSGALLWARPAGGANGDNLTLVAAVPDGSCVVGGSGSGDTTFGAGEPNETRVTESVLIARYGADGSLLWATGAGGAISRQAIAAFEDGGCVLLGRLTGEGTFARNTPQETALDTLGDDDFFLARYHPDGALSWARRDGGVHEDEVGSVATLPDGSVVVTGSFEEEALFGAGEPNETLLVSGAAPGPTDFSDDVFLARYAPDGSLAEVRGEGGAEGSDDGIFVQSMADGSLLVVGKYNAPESLFDAGGPNETVLPTVEGDNFFIARYAPGTDGRLDLVEVYGETGVEPPHSSARIAAAFDDGSVVVVGPFDFPATFGDGEPNETMLVPEGKDDIFLARYAPVAK